MKKYFIYTLHQLRLYLKVYKTLVKLSWAMLFAYRTNLITSSIAHVVWGGFIIISMVLLAGKASSVYGWSREELLVLAGMYNIIFSIFYFFCSRNFSTFAETIHYGRLDTMLTKPIDTQFLLSFLLVNITQVIRFTIGWGVILYMLVYMHVVISFESLGMFLLALIPPLLIIYCIWMLVLTLLIWFTNLSNLSTLLYNINSVSRFPQEMFSNLGIALFVVLFPLTLVVVLPTKALLQKLTLSDLVLPFCIASGLFILTRVFWKFAIRSYTSASG